MDPPLDLGLPQTPTGHGYGFNYCTILEETFLNTPVPQATSTINRKSYLTRIPVTKPSALTLEEGNESYQLNAGDGTSRLRSNARNRLPDLAAKLDQLQLDNQEQSGTFSNNCEKRSVTASDNGSIASSLGILQVDSLEEFPDETKRIAQMLELTRSSCDSSNSDCQPDKADNFYESHLSTSSRPKTAAEVSYLVSDLRLRKQRALALRAINKSRKPEEGLSFGPSQLCETPSVALANTDAEFSSTDVSRVASDSVNPFCTTFDNNGTKNGNSFSAEEFMSADCSRAAANLLADELECIKRNEEIAPPLTSDAPIEDISQIVSVSNPDVTVGSTFLGTDLHGKVARLPIDEFFRMRTDKIGELGETDDNQRPNFGRNIISPEKRRSHRARSADYIKVSSYTEASKDAAVDENQLLNDENSIPGVTAKSCLTAKNPSNKTTDGDIEKDARILKDNSNIVQQTNAIATGGRQSVKGADKSANDTNAKEEDVQILDVVPSEKLGYRDASYDGDCSNSTKLSGTLLTINDVDYLHGTVSDSELSDGWLLMDVKNPTKCNYVGARVDVTETNGYENMIELRTETRESGSLNFGLLPEQCRLQLIVTLLNRSTAECPLRIAIVDDSPSNVFSFTDGDSAMMSQVERRSCDGPLLCRVKPQQKLHLLVSCNTPSLQLLGVPQSAQVVALSGVLSVELDSGSRPQLQTLDLLGRVGFTLLSFSKDSTPLLTLKCAEGRTATHAFPLRNDGAVPLDIIVEVEAVEAAGDGELVLSVQPAVHRLVPGCTAVSLLRFTPRSVEPRFSDYRLVISIEPDGQRFESEVLCVATAARVGRAVSHSSDGSTRGSTGDTTKNSSEDSGDTTLQIKSTQKALSWASLQVGKSHSKSFIVKNFASHTSKVLVTVTDPTKAYKLRNDQGEEVEQLKLKLSANEACKLSVILKPSKIGPLVGTVEFASVAPASGPPQQMKLYAYCGQGQLCVQGIPKDGAGRLWLSLGTLTSVRSAMQTRFHLHNTGSVPIFNRIKLIAKGVRVLNDQALAVEPSQMVIAAGQSVAVRVIYQPQPSDAISSISDVTELATLQILTGDEATRLRLRRLLKKFKSTNGQLASSCGLNVGELCAKLPGEQSVPNIEMLRDPESAMSLLCHSLVVQEVSLIMERAHEGVSGFGTQSMLCSDESTRLFHTLCDDSETTAVTRLEQSVQETAVSWSVWPKEITLTPPAIKSKDVWVRNASDREQTFEVEVCQDNLLVRPSQGTVSANSQVKLTVYCTSLGGSNQQVARIKILMENDMQVVDVQLRPNRASTHTAEKSAGQVSARGLAQIEASTPLGVAQPCAFRRSMAADAGSSLANRLKANLDDTIISGSGLSSIVGGSHSPQSRAARRIANSSKTSRRNRKSFGNENGEVEVSVTKKAAMPCNKVEEMIAPETFRHGVTATEVDDRSPELDVVSEPASSSTARRSIVDKSKEDVRRSAGVAAARSDDVEPGHTGPDSAADHRPDTAAVTAVSRLSDTIDEEPTRDLTPTLGPCQQVGVVPGVFSDNYDISFPSVTVGRVSSFKITLKNPTNQNYKLTVTNLKAPFSATSQSFEMKAKWYLSFKAFFKPTTSGQHRRYVLIEPSGGVPLRFVFSGTGVPK